MSKLIIDIENEPKKNDILVFNGEKWECKNKYCILKEIKEELKEIKESISVIEDKLSMTVNGVNERLKKYHDILQVITKE